MYLDDEKKEAEVTPSQNHIKMDFTLETPEERCAKVKEIIANTPPEKLSPVYLERLADYMVFAIGKQKKELKSQKQKIITANQLVTINRRETSFEGLVGKLENGEDGIYALIANDKNILFNPKKPINEKDVAEIPGMRELREAIATVETQAKKATGKLAYALGKQLIEMRQDQYVLKETHHPRSYSTNLTKSAYKLDLSETIEIDENGLPHSNCIINFFNPKHISILLCNYHKFKGEAWDKLQSDIKWMMEDLDAVSERALADYPLYQDLVLYKIDGKSNAEIQSLLEDSYGVKHSVEYLSSLWRNKIPKMIADKAIDEYLIWHYTEKEKGKWKRCSRCGQIKLAHNRFFSKNNTSKDKFYSICKACRNKKNKEK